MPNPHPASEGTKAEGTTAQRRGPRPETRESPEEQAALAVMVKLRDLWEMHDFADWDEKFEAARDVPGYLARFRAHP